MMNSRFLTTIRPSLTPMADISYSLLFVPLPKM